MADYLKRAFLEGAQEALRNYGILPSNEPSTLQKALPWVAGGLAAPLAYKYLRTPAFAKAPGLRKIQEAAQKGFHRVVDVSRAKLDPSAPWYEKLVHHMQPHVNPEGDLNWWNKLKLWATEGGEAIPVASKKGKVWIPGKKPGESIKTKGVVHGRHIDLSKADLPATDLIRGGKDLEGGHKTQKALTAIEELGKGYEADVVQRYAPKAYPETMTDISPHLEGLRLGTAEERINAIRELQQRLAKHYGPKSDYLLKPTLGLQSAGAFPWGRVKDNAKLMRLRQLLSSPKSTEELLLLDPKELKQLRKARRSDWGTALQRFEKHIADPKNLKAMQKEEAKSLGDLGAYLEKHKIEEGRILYKALTDPKSVIAQRAVKNPLGEYRVHLISGSAPRNLILPRYNPEQYPALLANRGDVKLKDLQEFAEKTIAKFPKKYRRGTYGLDVMPFKKKDGTIGFKIIELNPSSAAGPGPVGRATGGGSGLTDVENVPFAGHTHYRAVTGRHTTPVALAGGLGAGGLLGGATALTTERPK